MERSGGNHHGLLQRKHTHTHADEQEDADREEVNGASALSTSLR